MTVCHLMSIDKNDRFQWVTYLQGVAHQARLRQYQKITDGALLPPRLNVPELSNLRNFQ